MQVKPAFKTDEEYFNFVLSLADIHFPCDSTRRTIRSYLKKELPDRNSYDFARRILTTAIKSWRIEMNKHESLYNYIETLTYQIELALILKVGEIS